MKQPTDKKIEEIIDILNRAQVSIDKEVTQEEAEDTHEMEDEAWKFAAAKRKETELLNFLKLNNINFSDGIYFRRTLTFILLRITMIWLGFIAIIIILQGLYKTMFPYPGNYQFGFHLESNVMMTVLTTTTITVLGLFLVVTRHIFHRNHNEDSKIKIKEK